MIISFTGISGPYTNKSGFYVTPIEQNPTQADIDRAIKAAETEEPHSGLNGRAYFYGQDLVVKKYLPKNEACAYDPSREISKMDSMYEMGIRTGNFQRGRFAFTSPANETYLVSTKITGQNPNPETNKFNFCNLSNLVTTIGNLDLPIRDDSKRETDLPYKVPVHYDLTTGNINITKDEGGLFDFEYMQIEDFDKGYSAINNSEQNLFFDTIIDFSDIAGIVSNLRNFEYRCLLKYLKALPNKEAKSLFYDYIQIKSIYHLKRNQFFENETEKARKDGNYFQYKTLSEITKKEENHYYCLSKASPEIIKAEAMKIQIASFLYAQSQFSHSKSDKINPVQILNYISQANKFFNEQYNRSDNFYKKLYFEDCMNLMKSWNVDNVKSWMNWQNNTEDKDIRNTFKSKLTKDKIVTLDEIVC